MSPLFAAPFPAELEGLSMNRLADALDDEETIKGWLDDSAGFESLTLCV